MNNGILVIGNTVTISISWTCAPLRLLAFQNLGKDFTFIVTKPKRLVTTGVYKWVQHPSYTGVIGLRIADPILLQRTDGVGACVFPDRIIRIPWISEIVGGILLMGVLGIAYVRIREEERVLRETFGKEWVEWRGMTRAFVPGLF
jgi:protein-S-isoprenylcysteine O-methyltransferase Ste14